MSIRMSIAKWLAPDVFRKADETEKAWKVSDAWAECASVWSVKAAFRGRALDDIITRATTKSPNSTVKAIMKIAQDALEAK